MKTSRQIKGLLVTVALMAYFASASCILLSLQAEAQTIEHVLRGLSQIALLVGKPNKASLDCGLNTDTIRNAVRYPASSAKFQLTDVVRGSSIPNEIFLVDVTSLLFEQSSLCVSGLSIQVYSYETATLTFSHREISLATIELWNKNIVLSSIKAEHSRIVSEQIEDFMKQFITDWNLDNKDEK